MSWYNKGFDGAKQAAAEAEALRGVDRFWLEHGAEKRKDVVFVDGETFNFYEHNLMLNGRYGNTFTCSHGVGEGGDACAVCEIAGYNTRGFVGMLTVIDCTKFTSTKSGKDYQYQLKLFPASVRTIKLFQIKEADHGSLAMSAYKVMRTDDKSPRVGNDFTFVKHVTDPQTLFERCNYAGKKLPQWFDEADASEAGMSQLTALFQVRKGEDGKLIREIPAFNYVEVLKPIAPRLLKQVLAGYKPGEKAGGKEDIPF